jgi:hypothetical protein
LKRNDGALKPFLNFEKNVKDIAML